MGIWNGAFSENKLDRDDPFSRYPKRCWNPFPRKHDLPLLPSIVAQINVCELNEDLSSVNQGSPLTAYGCSFSPDSDRMFSVISAFRNQLFLQDPLNHIDLRNDIPTAGFVTIWSVREDTDYTDGRVSDRASIPNQDFFNSCSPSMFTYSPRPFCSFSPDGKALTVVLNSGMGVLTIAKRENIDDDHCSNHEEQPRLSTDCENCTFSSDEEDGSLVGDDESFGDADNDVWFANYSLYPNNNGRGTLCGRVQCALYSSCGTKLATINKVSLSTYRNRIMHELSFWEILSNAKLRCLWSASCEVLCPQFTGAICSCKFSSRSCIIGLASTHGFCMFVSAKSGDFLSLISPMQNQDPVHRPCDFDFDPTAQFFIALVWRDGPMKLFNLLRNDASLVHMYTGRHDEPFSNCLKYSSDGQLIAIGTMTGQIHLVSSKTGCCIQYLNIAFDAGNHTNPTVFDVDFARSCQELIAAYSDGCVRIWQLPRIMNLQHICRLAILQGTKMNEINELPLPNHIKSYLLYDVI